MSPRKRKYKRRKKGIFSSLKYNKNYDLELSPETSREIAGFSLIGAGLIFFLFSLGFAGSVGVIIYNLFQMLIGWSTVAVPFILVFIGISFLKPEQFQVKPTTLVGLGLFIVSLSSLVHLLTALNASVEEISSGIGGGYLGSGISFLFNNLFGFWASLIIFIGLMISAILMTFNTTTAQIKELIENFRKDKERDSRVVVNAPEEFKPKAKPIFGFSKKDKAKEAEGEEVAFTSTHLETSADKNWELPSFDLLSSATTQPDSGNIKQNVKIIEQTLENFGVQVEMIDVNIGPTVTQYTLKPDTGVKLNKITNLSNDLALALAAHPIRIEAPIPGKSLVGIEVPNEKTSIVRLRGLLESQDFSKRKSNLTIVLGRDVSGAPVYADLDTMPHLLIAGSTGSGKSVCINDIILSFMYQNSPRDLKLILVDPKKVELSVYNGLPHLLTPVVTEIDKTVNALKWVVSEMEGRYSLFQKKGKRDIKSYNNSHKDEKLPYIVIIIDELADLMVTSKNEVEGAIVRLAQLARATGIHLIVATQRPSVDVITGLIKANISTRIAFTVSSQVDSRTILDQAGAEKLMGNGDMLYQASDISKPRRIQGAFIAEEETGKVSDFIKEQESASYDEEIIEKKQESSSFLRGGEEEPLFREAVEEVINAGKASASLLQRRLRVGYARAARLLDILEGKGIIGPQEGAKPRDVFIDDVSQLDQRSSEEQSNEGDAEDEIEKEVEQDDS